MKFYAIRRKVDGAYLPTRKGRGFTHDEPSLEKPPRLFEKKSSAKLALNQWLKGPLTITSSYDYETGNSGDVIEKRGPARVSEMEIVGMIVYPEDSDIRGRSSKHRTKEEVESYRSLTTSQRIAVVQALKEQEST